jgi:hypothetical protein
MSTTASVATRLEELGEAVQREYGLAQEALSAGVQHAILCGEALLEARSHVPKGGWEQWVTECGLSTRAAAEAMRFAFYKERIIDAPNRQTANGLLEGLPVVPGSRSGIARRLPDSMRAQARTLREEGVTYAQIGAQLGIATPTAHAWLNDGAERKRRSEAKRSERRRVQREEARDREVARALGKAPREVAESYSMIRKTAQIVHRAQVAADGEVAVSLRAAAESLADAERRILRAVGVA